MQNTTKALDDREFMLQLEELIALVSEARALLSRIELETPDAETRVAAARLH